MEGLVFYLIRTSQIMPHRFVWSRRWNFCCELHCISTSVYKQPRSLTHIELLSIIWLHCCDFCSQSGVSQEMFTVCHLDLQLLLQRQFKKFDPFLDQGLLNSCRDRCILDVEKADIDNCSSERLQELWFCCRVIGKSEVEQRNLVEGRGIVCSLCRGRDLILLNRMLGSTRISLTKLLIKSSRAFCRREAFLLNSKLCPPPGSSLASSFGVLVNKLAAWSKVGLPSSIPFHPSSYSAARN